MIAMGFLNKSISFNVSGRDKKKLQRKAEEIGIPLARMIRNIVLEKYGILSIGYVNPNLPASPIHHDIDIKRLRPPQPVKIEETEGIDFRSRDFINGYTECICELKVVLEERRKQIEEQELILIT